jgi:ABC-type sugar transport system permease subunit
VNYVAITLPPLDLFTVKFMALVTVFVVSIASVLASRINRQVPGLRLFRMALPCC